ncbi:hypothetical protein K3495_g6874 [Podosphaera aphanis]|nr:hypothetical protein K3495_g6874 [Podosphaera aphanis]
MDETKTIIDDIINDYMSMSQQDIDYLPNLGLETINPTIKPLGFPGFTQELPILESISPPEIFVPRIPLLTPTTGCVQRPIFRRIRGA